AGPGGRLHVARGPAHGPPLVLLHGITRRWNDFAPLLPALAARWEVFALDHRGHGLSDRAGRYGLGDYAADAAAWLAASVRESAVVVGHSLGALTALLVAQAERERVRGLVLEDPPGFSVLANPDATPFGPLFRGLRDVAAARLSVAET